MAVEELSLSTVTTVPVNWLAHRAFEEIDSAPQEPPFRATESDKRAPGWIRVSILCGSALAMISGLTLVVIGILR